jgi:hypothetical protein
VLVFIVVPLLIAPMAWLIERNKALWRAMAAVLVARISV